MPCVLYVRARICLAYTAPSQCKTCLRVARASGGMLGHRQKLWCALMTVPSDVISQKTKQSWAACEEQRIMSLCLHLCKALWLWVWP